MAQNYLAKLRKNRELKVTVGRWTFTGRRPTDVEAGGIFSAERKVTLAQLAADYITGWDLVEDDVIGGGGQDPVPFSEELWREWCADHPAIWEPIGTRILDAYTNHLKTLEDAAKNSAPGSKQEASPTSSQDSSAAAPILPDAPGT